MSIRRTDTKIPDNFLASDLGQAISNAASTMHLIACLTSPLTIDAFQDYVVFITDAVAERNLSFEWGINLNGVLNSTNTNDNWHRLLIDAIGNIDIEVKIKDEDDSLLETLSLSQTIGPNNPELVEMLSQEDQNIPVAAHPETSKEIVGNYQSYIGVVEPSDGLGAQAMRKFIAATTYAHLLQNTQALRTTQIDQYTSSLNDDRPLFSIEAFTGVGVSKLRPHILAMVVNKGASPYLEWREFPEETLQLNKAENNLIEEFKALDITDQIDIFNLLRFAKSNIKMCGLFYDELKRRFLSDESYEVIITDESKALRLINHWEKGPMISV